PFFLLGALWAAAALALWLAMLAGAFTLPSSFEPVAWHRHEMLFGYLAAIVAAFLLTAVPNWTGRLPVRGAPLAGLVLLWCLAPLPVPFGGLDKAVMALTAAALLAWLVLPAGVVAGALLLAAAAGTALRLARWRGGRTTPEPLLLVLHVGYAWLVVGLALLGL